MNTELFAVVVIPEFPSYIHHHHHDQLPITRGYAKSKHCNPLQTCACFLKNMIFRHSQCSEQVVF